MLFSSFDFIFFFLPAILAGYFILNRYTSYTTANLYLLAGSVFFYGYWNYLYLPLIIGSVLVNFTLGKFLGIDRYSLPLTKKHILVLGIIFNLALLCFFKYIDFFSSNINLLFNYEIESLKIDLPLAISFFLPFSNWLF